MIPNNRSFRGLAGPWAAITVLVCLAAGCTTQPPHSGHNALTAPAPVEPTPNSRAMVTALDRYVARPDTNHQWRVVATIPGRGITTTVIDLESQVWRTTNEVNRVDWKHWLVITRPDNVERSTALLVISGGANGRSAPTNPNPEIALIAGATRSVVAELKMVPNEPLQFAGEPRTRNEDAIIAYTWDKFLRGGDETWPLQLPMTKSAVRAMDTITEYCASTGGGQRKVDQFVVAGASKRGWTTWLTAAVDRRVVGIAPIVIDVLNVEESFKHHYGAYGFFAPAVKDYVEMGIMNWMGRPESRRLYDVVDPYVYRDRLTMPKYLINAAGDQFFLPDSSQFYFQDLKGVKHLRYVPNADHSLRGSDAWMSLLVWYQALLTGTPLPSFDWTLLPDGGIRVKTASRPMGVKLWQASNPAARDFRLATIGAAWQDTALTDQGDGVYVGRVPEPARGWTAFMIELTFPGPGTVPFTFTTPVRVVPDKLPYGAAPLFDPWTTGRPGTTNAAAR